MDIVSKHLGFKDLQGFLPVLAFCEDSSIFVNDDLTASFLLKLTLTDEVFDSVVLPQILDLKLLEGSVLSFYSVYTHKEGHKFFMLLKTPINELCMTDQERALVIGCRQKVESFFEELSVESKRCLPADAIALIRMVSGLGRPLEEQACDKTPLNEQVFTLNDSVHVQEEGVESQSAHISVLVANKLPLFDSKGALRHFFGNKFLEAMGHTPHVFSLSVYYASHGKPKQQRKLGNFSPKFRIEEKKFIPDPDFDEDGETMLRMQLTLSVFGDDVADGKVRTKQARLYAARLGFQFQEDRNVLPLFILNVPFGADFESMMNTQRYKTVGISTASKYLPLFVGV